MTPALPNLVADIGGTNTRVALAVGAQMHSDTIRHYANDSYTTLDAVLRDYLATQGQSTCHGACIAMAGPVDNGSAHLTNRDWSMTEARLAQICGAEHAMILNDLQAQGHAVGHLPDEGSRLLQDAPSAAPGAPKLVIGIGTGFNVAPVIETAPLRTVCAAEAGHALLPLRNAEDLSLAAFLARDHGVASIEDLLSGRGVEAAYAWAAQEAGVAAHLSGREALQAAKAGTDPEAERALHVLTRIMGVVFSDLALNFLPVGGIYLSGGVARALSDQIATDTFRQAYRDKGRFSAFMDQFAIHVIEDDCAALIGCAAHLNGISASV